MEDYLLPRIDPRLSHEYFDRKLRYTLGPMEVQYFKDERHEDFIIVDVRDAESYAAGHVPGAINLPEDEWKSLKGLQKGKTHVVYCYSVVCHLAARAARFFSSQGYGCMEMDGGWDYWEEYELPVEKGGGQPKVA